MKKLTVQIPRPCHERWANMQPDEHGRFCASCQKTVVDFTALSDRELVHRLNQASGELCGRLRYDQLDRPLIISTLETTRWRHWLSILTMGALSWQTAQAQSDQISTPARSATVQPLKALSIRESVPEDTNQVILSGRVMFADSTGAASIVPNATVHVLKADPLVPNRGQLKYGQTDKAGVFRISIPVSWPTGKLLVSVYTPEYSAFRIHVNAVSGTNLITLEDIVLNETMHVKPTFGGGLTIVKSPSRWQRIKQKLFRKNQ